MVDARACDNCSDGSYMKDMGTDDLVCGVCGHRKGKVNVYRHELVERESILTEAERIVNGSRNEDYGDSSENIRRIVGIANAMGVSITPVEFCKVMIATKLGRLMHRYKRDSLTDLAGYSELWSRLEEM